mmetsp:Transcript_5596/g.18853  ORF Transcript_5596/g.18853 Transcript_5596/m.18853 type:complete len:287 (-) Transcript_5596:1032-1892(-)
MPSKNPTLPIALIALSTTFASPLAFGSSRGDDLSSLRAPIQNVSKSIRHAGRSRPSNIYGTVADTLPLAESQPSETIPPCLTSLRIFPPSMTYCKGAKRTPTGPARFTMCGAQNTCHSPSPRTAFSMPPETEPSSISISIQSWISSSTSYKFTPGVDAWRTSELSASATVNVDEDDDDARAIIRTGPRRYCFRVNACVGVGVGVDVDGGYRGNGGDYQHREGDLWCWWVCLAVGVCSRRVGARRVVHGGVVGVCVGVAAHDCQGARRPRERAFGVGGGREHVRWVN